MRGPGSTKFSSGSVLVVGASTGLTGAVCLACEGAMRAGAGWIRAAVPESLNQIFEVKLTEVMSLPMPDSGGALVRAAADSVLEATERADAVVLGPGMGRAPESFALAVDLIERIERPLLIDADGLNALAEAGLERAAGRDAPTVLTPHAGELGRLLGRPSADVAEHRLASAREAAERSGAVTVLKGDDTIVARPGEAPVAISPRRRRRARDRGHRRRAERRDRRIPRPRPRRLRRSLRRRRDPPGGRARGGPPHRRGLGRGR